MQTEKLSPKLLEAIAVPGDGGQKVVESNLTSDSGETVTEGSLIVLIQTISAKTITPEQQDVQQQPANLSEGTSLHRLHALVQSGDSIQLFPVVLKTGAQTRNKKQLLKWPLPDLKAENASEETPKEIRALCYKQKEAS